MNQDKQMQTLMDLYVIEVVFTALLIQTTWIFVARMGRDRYITDLTHFRKPSSSLSNYYQWRVSSVEMALLDVIIFHVFMGAAVIILALVGNLLSDLITIVPVFLFIFSLSLLGAGQSVWRVKQLRTIERDLMISLRTADDKIARAQSIIDNMEAQGGDGHAWFVLFELAQESTPIGYSVRDVLIEKGKQVAREQIEIMSEEQDTGPAPE